MGAVTVICLNSEQPDLEDFVDSKAISHAYKELGVIAEFLNISKFEDFYSADPENEMERLESMEVDTTNIVLPPEAWFSPSEGLITVRAFKNYIDEHPNSVPSADQLRIDLDRFEHVLMEAEKRGLLWHSWVDI